MPVEAGVLCWVGPNTSPNYSSYSHFAVVVFADEENVLFTTLSSVKPGVLRHYDKTCEFDMPRVFLRVPDQTRRHYVRYDQIRAFPHSYIEGFKPLGSLPDAITGAIVEGLLASPETSRSHKRTVLQAKMRADGDTEEAKSVDL